MLADPWVPSTIFTLLPALQYHDIRLLLRTDVSPSSHLRQNQVSSDWRVGVAAETRLVDYHTGALLEGWNLWIPLP